MLQFEIDTPLYELIKLVGEKGAVASYDACYKAIDQLGEIASKIKSKAGFKKKDSLYFAAFKKDMDWLSSYAIISEVDEKLYRQYKDVLIWNTADPYLYMRTSDDGRFLIGGEDEEFRNPPKRDALSTNSFHHEINILKTKVPG